MENSSQCTKTRQMKKKKEIRKALWAATLVVVSAWMGDHTKRTKYISWNNFSYPWVTIWENHAPQ